MNADKYKIKKLCEHVEEMTSCMIAKESQTIENLVRLL